MRGVGIGTGKESFRARPRTLWVFEPASAPPPRRENCTISAIAQTSGSSPRRTVVRMADNLTTSLPYPRPTPAAERKAEKIRLIPSENYVSKAVLEATGTVLTNKYSEGYPGRRYYEGQQIIDQVETIAIERAKALFGVEHANVQPYSGSPANLAVYFAFVQPGDTIMGMALPMGGHLTHGWGVSVTGKWFRAVTD